MLVMLPAFFLRPGGGRACPDRSRLKTAAHVKAPDEQVCRSSALRRTTALAARPRDPRRFLAELAAKLGLDVSLEIAPDELAATVMRSGKPLPFQSVEDLIFKRLLVNGSQRLELAGFAPARLAWYKPQGCFTEIIRYQARLFVPVDRAAEVLARLHDDKSA